MIGLEEKGAVSSAKGYEREEFLEKLCKKTGFLLIRVKLTERIKAEGFPKMVEAAYCV